jgi:hypothetical protein
VTNNAIRFARAVLIEPRASVPNATGGEHYNPTLRDYHFEHRKKPQNLCGFFTF